MKLTSLLLFIAFMQVSAATLAQKVTLSEKDAPLTTVLTQIKKQTGYDFAITGSVVEQAKPVTINVKNEELRDVLSKIFEMQPLQYAIEDNSIVVRHKDPTFIDKIKAAIGAPVTVTATVHDELGGAMPGVTVREKGTNNTTITDNKGHFTIDVPEAKTPITFTYVGYEPQELRASDIPNNSTITLKVAETNLKEVVINKGYYNEKRALSTGDVSIVSAKTIGEQPVSDPILALEGRVPGLNIQQSSGLPGAYSKIQIRGQNSIANGNDPLYVIDGVPFSALSLSPPGGASAAGAGNPAFNQSGGGLSPFNGLNPADIESIEVLKDADATAIYGSRGANGVILITTKRGKAGDTRFDLNAYSGAGTVSNKLNMLNTQQYLQIRHEAFKNDGIPFPNIKTDSYNSNYDVNGVWDTTRNTDWQKVLIGGTAHFTNMQGDLSGGNANTQFLIGGGYSRQGNVFPGDFSDKKAMAHVNLTHQSTNGKFSAQLAVSYVNDTNDLPSVDLTSAINLAPDAPSLFDPTGNINWQMYNGSATFQSNPVAYLLLPSLSVTQNLVSHLSLQYTLFPGLDLKTGFGYNHDEMNATQITPSTSFAPPLNTFSSLRILSFGNTDFSSWIIEPQISYKKNVGKGKLEALVGSSFQENKADGISQLASGFTSDALISSPINAASIRVFNANNTLYHYEAFYGRLGYILLDKYILNVTGRRDGSSRFGPGKQFGNFGSIGAGWIFSEDKFVKNHLPFLSFGKLRASYGTSGNDQIGDYQFLSRYSSDPITYQGINGLTPVGLTNPYFAWELVKKLEAGIELGFLNDRIMVDANYYRNRTGNQLVGLSQPSITGFTSIQFNLPAVVQNSGFEFTVNTVNVKTPAFQWRTSINGTLPYNKLISFPDIANFPSYSSLYEVGKSLYIRQVFHATGVNPQTGFYSFQTQNSNGVPSFGTDELASKPFTQYFYGGISNSFSYKGFTLDVFIQYVNQYGYNWRHAFTTGPGYFNYNVPNVAIVGRWNGPGDQTTIQRPSTMFDNIVNEIYEAQSDAALGGASFLRLKNVALSYNLPNTTTEKWHIKNAKVYLQCQNLFTITKYIGLDPETAGTLSLPPLRMITAGFQAGF